MIDIAIIMCYNFFDYSVGRRGFGSDAHAEIKGGNKMQRLVKPVSILLSIIMIVSVFTIIPANASVIDEKAQMIADVVSAELAAGDAELDPAVLEAADATLPVRSKDLAETGADVDLSKTGHYDIAVGYMTVTGDNYTDVFGDGRVSYDPINKVLTLRDPKIGSTKGYDYGAIHIQTDDVTVRGSYHMTSALSKFGLFVSDGNSVTLEGDFTFRGKHVGVIGNDITVNSGTLRAFSTNTLANSCAVYSDDFTVNSGISSVEMQCSNSAFIGDMLTLNGTKIVSDDSFFTPIARGIIDPDMYDLATRVVIKPYSATYYDLWLGTRRVDSNNYTDIYGDGTASYDPAAKILTLNDPVIRGAHVGGDVLGVNYKIYSGYDLTVKGSYKMTSEQLVLSPDITPDNDEDGTLYLRSGVYSTGNLTLDGDFAFAAKYFPVCADNDIVINSGTVKAFGSENTGIHSINGSVTVKGGVTKIDAQSDVYPLCAKTALTIEDGVYISTPRNGIVAMVSNSGVYTVMDPSDSSPAKHVVIESGTVERYNLFLGQTEVTSANCDDIFGDGTASYSPSTKTLILNDPVINGAIQNGNYTYKILTSVELTLKGSYHMTDSETDIGISSSNKLTLDGDFTFKGEKYAIYDDNGVTVKSGTLTAVSNSYAAVGVLKGEFYVGNGITKVDMQGTAYPVFAQTISLIGVNITTPTAHAILNLTDIGVYSIGSTDGSSSSRAVIEPITGESYGVWLGSKVVTSNNKDDIFKDGGSAKYDPDTHTLTLSEPNISGFYKNGDNTFRIFSYDSLNIEGSYNMANSDGVTIGLFSNDTLTLNGDFTFMGTNHAVYAANGIDIIGGSLTAIGNTMGVISYGPVTVGDDVIKIDSTGGAYAFVGSDVTLSDELNITEPSGGSIERLSQSFIGVADTWGNGAEHAVIERKPAPTEPPTNPPTDAPSAAPSEAPSAAPSEAPSAAPSEAPSAAPSEAPSAAPSEAPSAAPSEAPSAAPSEAPSAAPSAAPSEAPSDVPSVTTTYYIVGPFTNWLISEEYKLTKNTEAQGEEYFFKDFILPAGSSFKVVKIENDKYIWYPAGTDNNYEITSYGSYDIYFRPNSDGGDGWYQNVIYVSAQEYYPELEGKGTENAPYLIKSAEDWDSLATFIANGNSTAGKFFKLTDDITVTKGVGSSAHPFSGTFDGDGKTLTFNAASSGGATAPFINAKGASFIHLHTAGTIDTSSKFAGGLVGEADGDVTITDCRSSVTINSSIQGDGTHGGFIGRQLEGSVIIRGCLFDGKLLGAGTERCGGFAGWRNKTMEIYDSMFAPSEVTVKNSGSATFARNKVDSYNSYFTYLLNDGGEFAPYLSDGNISPKRYNNGQQAYTISADDGVTLSFGTPADDAVYEVSGITSYGVGLIYNGAFYAGDNDTIAIAAEPQEKHFSASARKFSQDGGSLKLTMPAGNVVISAIEIGLEGEGTEEAPYLIKTSEDWDAFTAYAIAGNFKKGEHFKLADDITVATAVNTNAFNGIFDGDGHTLTLDNLSGAPFGSISGATIKNLKIDGSVSGGRHISALVSGCEGVYENLIENVVVAADIATNDTYCGGFVGHGGSTAKTTLRNCVFSGTFSQGSTIGTFWGWSDGGSTPVLERCFDISATDHPIGRGDPSGSITSCYYTNESKQTDGGRSWRNGGKRAYTVSGDEIELTLNGNAGLVYNGVIYAGEGDFVSVTVPSDDVQYAVSAGAFSQNGTTLSVAMPAGDVTVSLTDDIIYTNYSSSSANTGYNNEGADKLFDSNTGTKWCGTTNNGTPVVYFITGTKVVPNGYRLATANDTANNSGRNPISWTLEASVDGSSWVTLTDVSGFRALEAVNEKYYTFPLTNPTDEAYLFYRFSIKAIAGGSTFQLGELQLIGKDTGEEGEDVEYDVWLGSTQVTFANRNDILGDGGKAKYDPLSNTLTLNDPTIEGEYVFGDDQVSCKIYCGIEDMTVKGSYHMTEADTDRGIELHGAPVLDGNFTFMGKLRAILTYSDLTFRSGYVKAICPKTDAYAYPVYVNGVINFQDGFVALIAEGGISPIMIQLSSEVYNVSDKFLISTPEGGYFDHKPNSSSVQYVFNADGTVADRVMIERKRDYDLWLGSTRVTFTNRKDILGDGKAEFDPITNTLTLDNPKIEGYQSNGMSSIKILSYMDLRISGSYLMEEADANINLDVSGNLTLNGEFMFRSWGYCISSSSITVEAGSLIAVANWDYGISSGNIKIKEGVTRVELSCGRNDAIRYSSLTLEGKIGVSSPDDATIGNYSVYDSNGSRSHYVVFEPVNVITFDVQGHGAAHRKLKLPIDQKLTQPDAPTDEAYDFGGWFTDAECTAPYEFDTLVTDDLTLYAKWTIKKLTVDFDTNGHGEAAPESQIVEYGSAAAVPAEPTDEAYDFTGWFSDKDRTEPYDFSTAVKSDTTVYAGWSIKRYTAAFDANGHDTAPEDQIIDHGSTVTKPDDLSDTAYDFEGWFTDKACKKAYDFSAGVTGDLTLYAKWTVKKYTFTFDANGHGADPKPKTVDHGNTVVLPDDPTEAGYVFKGWYTDRDCKYLYNLSAPVTEDITVYAKWEQSGYTVTIVSANGSGAQYTESKLFNLGDEYTLPQCIFAAPSSMMAFKSWDKGNVGEKITINGDTVITAEWRKVYRLGDVDGDGDVTILDATYIQRKLAGLPLDIEFNEVTADADGDGEITILDATAIQRWLAGLPSNDQIGKFF